MERQVMLNLPERACICIAKALEKERKKEVTFA